jgi:DNA mismatch repair protein MutH
MFTIKESLLPYSPKNLTSVLTYAKLLINKSLMDVISINDAKEKYNGKGGFGNKVEEKYFYLKNNSEDRPDFKEINLELKVTPLKLLKNGTMSPKERLVLGKINYGKVLLENFESSSFIKKNSDLLIIFYLHVDGLDDYKYIFKHLINYRLAKNDLKIIKDDWQTIHNAILQGSVHLISESDTLYLAASTKAQNSSKLTSQPNGPDAKPRAFSFKPSFIKYLISDYLQINSQSVISVKNGLKSKKSFEEIIIDSFHPFLGKSEKDIKTNLKLNYSNNAKQKGYLLSRAILGIKKDNIEEFEKAGINVKTITLTKKGNNKESMSFKQIQFKTIINEAWKDSDLYNTLTNKFFFIIFQKDAKGQNILKNVKFWNMNENDLKIVKTVWLDTKNKISNNDFSNFKRISDGKISHVRPKATNKDDKMETSFGTLEEKKCFWLNASYIKEVISK